MKITSTLLIAFLCACTIVDDPNDASSITLDGRVDLGTKEIPSDQEVFASQLHGETTKTWIGSQFSIEGMEGFLDCRLDDTITLNADGTFQYDGGENLCGGEDDERLKSGNWSFDFASSELVFEPGTAFETRASIQSLDEEVITLTAVYSSESFGDFDIEGRYTSAE